MNFITVILVCMVIIIYTAINYEKVLTVGNLNPLIANSSVNFIVAVLFNVYIMYHFLVLIETTFIFTMLK